MRFLAPFLIAACAFGASTESPRYSTVVRADEHSGHLVRSVVVQPKEISAIEVNPVEVGGTQKADLAPASGLLELIERIATEHGVEVSLVHSVIRAESNYNPRAVSPKGAQGMMQLIPATARRFGVSNVFDPEQNILGGVKYLRFLLDYYSGDYPKVIAAYNAGEAAVDKFHGIPPYAETQEYVLRVAKNLKIARQYRASKPAVSPVTQAPAETFSPILAETGPDGRVYYKTAQ